MQPPKMMKIQCFLCGKQHTVEPYTAIRGKPFNCECGAEIKVGPIPAKEEKSTVTINAPDGRKYDFALTARADGFWHFDSDKERAAVGDLDNDSERAVDSK